MKTFLIINGPNLDMLGTREPELYGKHSLKEIMEYTENALVHEKIKIEWFQSNSEGEIIERIHKSIKENLTGLIINPAAFTHTSLAIADALKIVSCKIVEVHLSNTHARGPERQQKYTTSCVHGVLEGFGRKGYLMAVQSFLLPS
jgi:3-dehydroquinate dehydratase-2